MHEGSQRVSCSLGIKRETPCISQNVAALCTPFESGVHSCMGSVHEEVAEPSTRIDE